MKRLADNAVVAKASGLAERAVRKLEQLFVRSRDAEEKGDTDRSRLRALEVQLAALELRVAELERARG